MSFLLISRAKVSKSKSTHDFSVATQELEPVDPLLDGKYLNKLQQQMEKPSIALVMDQLQNKVPHCSSSSFFVNDKIFAFPDDLFRLKRSLGPVPNQRRLEKLAKRAQRSWKTKRIMKTTTCSCRPRCGQNWRPFTVSKKFVNIISDLNGSHTDLHTWSDDQCFLWCSSHALVAHEAATEHAVAESTWNVKSY